MKALVTGATGFLGSVLLTELALAGERAVRCFVRPGPKGTRLDALARAHPDAGFEPFVGTLTSQDDAIRAIEGVDVVYHLAAGLTGAAADLFLHTVVASKNLLEAVVRARKPPRVVLVSSFGVYGVAALDRGATIDESTPLEDHPERRDLYSQAKLRQERLFREYHARHAFPLTVVRPGVIYGPGGSPISTRVGLSLFGVFLHLGGNNILPLSYVENCAQAIVLAGRTARAVGETYNLVDDDLPTCREYLRLYRAQVKPLRTVPLPYPVTLAMSRLVERYHAFSRGQLPAVFTPYKTATQWGGNEFDNSKIKALGWKQAVPTEEGIRRTFASLRESSHR